MPLVFIVLVQILKGFSGESKNIYLRKQLTKLGKLIEKLFIEIQIGNNYFYYLSNKSLSLNINDKFTVKIKFNQQTNR